MCVGTGNNGSSVVSLSDISFPFLCCCLSILATKVSSMCVIESARPSLQRQAAAVAPRACPPPPRRARRRSPISNLSLNRRGFRDPFCAISFLQLLALSIARPYFRSFSVVRAFFLPSHSPPRFKGRHVFGYNYRHMINRV